jgi:hypothetical protein
MQAIPCSLSKIDIAKLIYYPEEKCKENQHHTVNPMVINHHKINFSINTGPFVILYHTLKVMTVIITYEPCG